LSGQLSRTQPAKAAAKSAGLIRDGEPALAGHAVRVRQVLAQEIEMRRAPGGDVLVVVAVGDGAADHQEQDLGQRMQDPPHVTRVLHLREVVEQRGEARLAGRVWAAPNQGRRIDSANLPPVTCRMSSEPCLLTSGTCQPSGSV
jgi:hypothetical protein